MSTDVDQHTWTAKLGVAVLDIIRGEVTLDRNWSPYAQGSLTIAMPDSTTFAALDPRIAPPHIALDVERRFSDLDFTSDETALWGGATTALLTTLFGGLLTSAITNYPARLVWNSTPGAASRRHMVLSVRGRDVNPDQSVTLTLASDEGILGDIRVLGAPYGGWVYVYATVRAFISAFLTSMGFTLQAGTADAAVPAGVNPAAPADTGIMYMGGSTWAEQFEVQLLNGQLKLWCDEAGLWHLEYPEYVLPATIVLTAGTNLSSQSEHIDRSSEDFAQRVLAYFTYPDPTTGAPTTELFYADSAVPAPGTATYSRKTVRIDFPTFPSYTTVQDMVQAMVDRMAKRGREVPVDAVSDYVVTPGMTLNVTTSWGPALHGPVTAVTWRHPENEMTIRSENLEP